MLKGYRLLQVPACLENLNLLLKQNSLLEFIAGFGTKCRPYCMKELVKKYPFERNLNALRSGKIVVSQNIEARTNACQERFCSANQGV